MEYDIYLHPASFRSQFTEQGETHSSKSERSGSASQGDQGQSGESANEFASEGSKNWQSFWCCQAPCR